MSVITTMNHSIIRVGGTSFICIVMYKTTTMVHKDMAYEAKFAFKQWIIKVTCRADNNLLLAKLI